MEINAQLPINSLGYGVAGNNLLHNLECRVNLFPIGTPEFTSPKIENSLENALTSDFAQPTIKLWHQHDLIQRVGRGKYFGFPIFELDGFSEFELLNLSCPDELITCSEWGANILRQYCGQKVSVVPLGVDTNVFYPTKEREGVYRFFTIGKWEIRKSHDVIIECFKRAFTNESVELHMLCDNPFLSSEQEKEWHQLARHDKIILHSRLPNHGDVASFIRHNDCYIGISKAEGWNLELLEAMACGKSVIATNYSAHTEFCTKDNSYLVDIDKVEPAVDGIWFHGDKGNWAYIGESEKEQIIEHMRYCYNNRPTNPNGVETAQKFTWVSAGKELLNVVTG
jgi:glycosyltransferase involved in cell wall biosynthesis